MSEHNKEYIQMAKRMRFKSRRVLDNPSVGGDSETSEPHFILVFCVSLAHATHSAHRWPPTSIAFAFNIHSVIATSASAISRTTLEAPRYSRPSYPCLDNVVPTTDRCWSAPELGRRSRSVLPLRALRQPCRAQEGGADPMQGLRKSCLVQGANEAVEIPCA